MRTSDFDFELPEALIAQVPAGERDQSRLLVLHRATNQLEHRRFRHVLEYLNAGDVLVLNNSRVIPARLRGENSSTGGQFEILLLEEQAPNDWWVMLRPGKRARVGTQILLKDLSGRHAEIRAQVLATNAEGHRRLRFMGAENILGRLDEIGEAPLPPYIKRGPPEQQARDRLRYQTVFAEFVGSVAAPTAGLHFTRELLREIESRGVQVRFVTLHVGLGTFAPVKSESIEEHVMHEERYELSKETVDAINHAKQRGRRVYAVGTTVTRVLESIAAEYNGLLTAKRGKTRIFIYPPYAFRIVDALITNFHLPRSTLLMLVSAFATPNEIRGREMILSAYAQAVQERYRFFSYGDAMLLL